MRGNLPLPARGEGWGEGRRQQSLYIKPCQFPRRKGRVAQGVEDHVEDVRFPVIDIGISERDYFVTHRLENDRPSCISLRIFVAVAVYLDHQTSSQADEVCDVGANYVLPSELEASEPAVTEQTPDPRLCAVWIAPQFA